VNQRDYTVTQSKHGSGIELVGPSMIRGVHLVQRTG